MQHVLANYRESVTLPFESQTRSGAATMERSKTHCAGLPPAPPAAADCLSGRPVRFGVEIEMQKLSLVRMQAQACMALRVPSASAPPSHNRAYDVQDAQGRTWEIKEDTAGINEMATPILQTRDDLETLCRVAAAFGSAGACTLGACGLHIHVDAASFFPRDMVNIMAVMALYEQPLEEALRVRPERFGYCKRTDPDAVRALYQIRHLPRDEFCMRSLAHVGGRNYNINMTNLTERDKHTIEFRLFNATLDPTVIAHYTSVVMGMVRAAKSDVDFYQVLQRAPKPNLAQFCAAVGLDPSRGTGAFLLGQSRVAIERPQFSPPRLHRRP